MCSADTPETSYLIARYMGRIAKRGKVCTLIMMVMKAMYRSTLMKPEEEGEILVFSLKCLYSEDLIALKH